VNLAPRSFEAVWGSDKEAGMIRPSGEAGEEGWRLRPEVVRLLRLFNVHWVISALPVVAPDLGPPEVFPEGYGIQQIPDSLPRVFVVEHGVPVADETEAIARLGWGQFDPATEALVLPGLEIPAGSASSLNVKIVSATSRSLRLEADIDAPGLLVVSEAYYPGWQAWIDDEPTTIHPANVMMRSVLVPAGKHQVRFEYRPRSVVIGFAISGLALIVLLASWRWLARPSGR
jgi:hypothetical protein